MSLGTELYSAITGLSAADKNSQQKAFEAIGNTIEDYGLGKSSYFIPRNAPLFNPQGQIELGRWPDDLTGSLTYPTDDNSTTPYGKVWNSDEYTIITTDYVPAEIGAVLYGEVYVMRESAAPGSAGTFYMGVLQYDKDKKPIAADPSNWFVASNVTIPTDGNWAKHSGTYTLPTSHTPYDGSDGGPVRYVKIRIIINYSSGTIATNVGGAQMNYVKVRRTAIQAFDSSGITLFDDGGNASLKIADGGNDVGIGGYAGGSDRDCKLYFSTTAYLMFDYSDDMFRCNKLILFPADIRGHSSSDWTQSTWYTAIAPYLEDGVYYCMTGGLRQNTTNNEVMLSACRLSGTTLYLYGFDLTGNTAITITASAGGGCTVVSNECSFSVI